MSKDLKWCPECGAFSSRKGFTMFRCRQCCKDKGKPKKLPQFLIDYYKNKEEAEKPVTPKPKTVKKAAKKATKKVARKKPEKITLIEDRKKPRKKAVKKTTKKVAKKAAKKTVRKNAVKKAKKK